MKINQNISFIILLALLISININAQDQSKSPYFFINSDKISPDQIPLKSTLVDVNITGTIADVTVQQLYSNEGDTPIEATYVFPASTRAAVYGMTMTIGDRTIKAKIKEKNEAKRMYEDAKSEGKRTTLLEQHRPNVFQMNVANIMPGDAIIVELKYTEILIPEKGEYSFIYPKVVGPRCTVEDKTHKVGFNNNPYLNEGEKSLSQFDINVNINAGMTIQDVCVKSHKTNDYFPSLSRAEITLNQEDGNIASDYILKYSLAGNKIKTGLLLYEGKVENFFLLTVQPPAIVKKEIIPAREYIFIVDISGSMNGFPLNTSKTLLRNLIGNLKPTDKFNIMLFAGSSKMLNPTSVLANNVNLEKALSTIDNQRGGGSTNMLSAITKAIALPKADSMSRSFVIVTDGYVSIERGVFDIIRNNLNKANFYAMGIGGSVNRFLIEGIAHVGQSEPFIITNPTDAKEQAERMRQYIQNPVLTNIDFDFEGIDIYDVEPISIPDVLGQRPVLIYGKYKGRAIGKLKIKGYSGAKPYEQSIDVSSYKHTTSNSALKYLWARKKLQILDDYSKLNKNKEDEKQIVALGLKYNLLTRFTSFIAIDNEPVNKKGNLKKVRQPLPLPQGVSNASVGFEAPKLKRISSGKKGYLKLTNIEVDESICKKSYINQLLKSKLSKYRFNTLKHEINVEVIIDKDGYVAGIKLVKGQLSKKQFTKLKYLLGSTKFLNLQLKKPLKISLTFK